MQDRLLFLRDIHELVAAIFQQRAETLAKGNPEVTKELLLLSFWVKSTVPTVASNVTNEGTHSLTHSLTYSLTYLLTHSLTEGNDMRSLYAATSNIPGSYSLEKYYYLHCTTVPTAIFEVLKEKKKIIWKAYTALAEY